MPDPLRDRLFDAVAEEFAIELPAQDRGRLATVGDLTDYVVHHHPPPGESLSEAELRDHVEAVLGEVLARVCGRGYAVHDAAAPLPGA
ncbi:MAG TPA: hypothetical protein VFS08_09325 [Gemmatimonadaceae bacterium]|nr:hypothetical protein [Gemmatimonadaceae bacterium]